MCDKENKKKCWTTVDVIYATVTCCKKGDVRKENIKHILIKTMK